VILHRRRVQFELEALRHVARDFGEGTRPQKENAIDPRDSRRLGGAVTTASGGMPLAIREYDSDLPQIALLKVTIQPQAKGAHVVECGCESGLYFLRCWCW